MLKGGEFSRSERLDGKNVVGVEKKNPQIREFDGLDFFKDLGVEISI